MARYRILALALAAGAWLGWICAGLGVMVILSAIGVR